MERNAAGVHGRHDAAFSSTIPDPAPEAWPDDEWFEDDAPAPPARVLRIADAWIVPAPVHAAVQWPRRGRRRRWSKPVALDVPLPPAFEGEEAAVPARLRPRIIREGRQSKRKLEMARFLHPDVDVDRPRTRGECESGVRPCPFVSCKHHLYLDYASSETGTLKLNFPDADPWELKETCSLDIAERGGESRSVIGSLLNVTPERIRQMEKELLEKLRYEAEAANLGDEL